MAIALRTDFDLRSILGDLDVVGASSFPVLTPAIQKKLLLRALTSNYVKRPRINEKSHVCQDVYGCDTFPHTSLFHRIRAGWQKILSEKIAELNQPSIFSTPLDFNEMSLQRYEADSFGITPHLDPASCINLICVFTLVGDCRFAICKDRDSHRYKDRDDRCSIELDARPGNVILMRAPGYRGSQVRPLHMVTDIKGPRISFGLRQKISTPPHLPTPPLGELS